MKRFSPLTHTYRPARGAAVAVAAVAAALFFSAVPRAAQAGGGQTTLADVIAGRAAPLTLRLKDLEEKGGGEWRRVRITLPADTTATNGPDAMERALTAALGGPAPSVYYTKGQVVTLDGQTFLLAYRPKAQPLDLKKPQPARLTPETTLTLSLVALRSAAALDDIRPFLLAEELKAQGEAVSTASDMVLAPETPAETGLHQVGLALLMYAQDHGDVLPAMKDAAALRAALSSYVPEPSLFRSPMTGEPFAPNPALSGRKYAHISAPESMVALYEATPAEDGTRAVLFLDGNVRRIGAADWPRVARGSKIAVNR
jgi:hypothetical protein